MKKAYSRPLLAFESFQLDAALAANCNIVMKWGEGSCSVDPDGTSYYGIGGEFFNYKNCRTDVSGICYQGPFGLIDINDVFFSSGY